MSEKNIAVIYNKDFSEIHIYNTDRIDIRRHGEDNAPINIRTINSISKNYFSVETERSFDSLEFQYKMPNKKASWLISCIKTMIKGS